MPAPADALPLAVERAGDGHLRGLQAGRAKNSAPIGGRAFFRGHWQMPTIADVTRVHGSAVKTFTTGEIVMRARHVIAAVAVILVGVGVKLIFFTAPTAAEADLLPIKSVGVETSQLHQNVGNLPVHKFDDLSFIFPSVD